MIRHLHLENWKSYDSLDVDFSAGTTFVVAPNGVGKTSIVEALAWAVYGDHARSVSPRDCIRAGADRAAVSVTIQLADGAALTIQRTVKRLGSPSAACQLNSEPIDSDAAEERLRSEYGIDQATAARLSVTPGGGHVAADKALDLQGHLHEAFGVANLLRASKDANRILKEARKETASLKAADSQRISDRDAVEAEIIALDEQLSEAQAAELDLKAELQASDEARQLATAWSEYSGETESMRETLADLATQVADTVSNVTQLPSEPETLRAVLSAAITDAQRKFEQSANDLIAVRAARMAAERGLELLEGDHANCPTCLRPLDSDSLNTAREAHHGEVDHSVHDEERLSELVKDVQAQESRLRTLLARVEGVRLPTSPSGETHPDPDRALQRHAEVLDQWSQVRTHLGALDAKLDGLRRQLEDDDVLKRLQEQLAAAYRKEGIAEATADALKAASEQITSTRIEPIATAVKLRWKQLFNEGGLELDPDGVVTRRLSGQELPWNNLSGGERTWARLVTQLLIIEASTRLPFLWLDEPLEHLDPKLRRSVAAFLADATRAGVPKQVIVTTYEHSLAAQLAKDIPQAHILHIRHGW